MKKSISSGALSDLRFACDFVDRFVDLVIELGDISVINKGFKAFRARNDYDEEIDEEKGIYRIHPLQYKYLKAPPPEKTGLGRFNRRARPVLYLATTREVALAECKALPSDTCSVGVFETVRESKIATLFPKQGTPLSWLNANAGKKEFDVELVRSCNIVFFDPKIAIPVDSGTYSINWKRPLAEQSN